jgi:hypothetical protein
VNKDDKSTLSKKNEEEILTGLLSYLENNIYSKSNLKLNKNANPNEMQFIKTQIEKYIEISKDRIGKSKKEGKILDVMTSFGKILPNKMSEPSKFQEIADVEKFQSLEKKYNDLIRLNEETQLQIKELKRNQSVTSVTKTTRVLYEGDKMKKDDLFKKMHEASIEMEVNKESRIFSTNSKKIGEDETDKHSIRKDKILSGSSDYLYSNIDKIYKNEEVRNQLIQLEDQSGKISGKNR